MTTVELMHEIAKYYINFSIYYDCYSGPDKYCDSYLGCKKYLRIFFRDKVVFEVAIDKEDTWKIVDPVLGVINRDLFSILLDLVRIYVKTPLTERGEV